MQNIVIAMKQSGAQRLVVVSALGIAESVKQCLWWYRWLVVPTFLHGITRDKKAMENIMRGSGLDWVIARSHPDRLSRDRTSQGVKKGRERSRDHTGRSRDMDGRAA
jgi:hypothetical protein